MKRFMKFIHDLNRPATGDELPTGCLIALLMSAACLLAIMVSAFYLIVRPDTPEARALVVIAVCILFHKFG